MSKTKMLNNLEQSTQKIFPVFDTRTVVFMGMLIALQIILERFLSFKTPILRISFGFLPISMAAILFGPIVGGITAALADVIGLLVSSEMNLFFPGFTLNAFLTGMVYGLLLYQKPKSLIRISSAVLMITLGISLGLGTLWVHMMTGSPFIAMLLSRIPKLIMIPIEVILIKAVVRCLDASMKQIMESR